MDGWMNILEVGPGIGRDALIVQLVLAQIQQSEVAAAPQRLLCHTVDHVPTHLQHLLRHTDGNVSFGARKMKSDLSTVLSWL